MFQFVILGIAILLWIGGVTYLSAALFYRMTRRELFVPFVPIDSAGVDAMARASKIVGNERVVDIGSGWGTIIFALLDRYPKLQVTGIEINPFLHLFAKLRGWLFHQSSSYQLFRGDAANFSFEAYEVVFLFMLSPFVDRVLVPKFEKELKSGTRVVSYVFPMQSKAFTEEKISMNSQGWRNAVYVYTKK